MDKKLVIIIPNELETRLPIFSTKCNWHQEAMFQFIYHNDLNLYGHEQESADTLSKCLTDMGFCIILVDEYRDTSLMVAYIPTKVSPKQLEYFCRGKDILSKYNILVALREENNSYKTLEKESLNKPMIELLIEELNKRLVKSKVKILKKTDNQN